MDATDDQKRGNVAWVMRILLVSCLVIASACAGPSRVGSPVDPAGEPVTAAYEEGCAGEESDPVELRGAELSGRRLQLSVRYGGGCEPHSFRVCDDDVGGHRILALLHDAHGDTCEAEVEALLEVELPNPPNVLVSMDGRAIEAR